LTVFLPRRGFVLWIERRTFDDQIEVLEISLNRFDAVRDRRGIG
jgi:hypothetical protein